MSAVTIVPLAPELSVIVTLRFEKSIPLSFMIWPSASVESLSVPFKVICPLPVSSAPRSLLLSSVSAADAFNNIESPKSSVASLPPNTPAVSVSKSMKKFPVLSSWYLLIKSLPSTSSSVPMTLSSRRIGLPSSSKTILSVSFLPWVPSSNFIVATFGPCWVALKRILLPEFRTIVSYDGVWAMLPIPEWLTQ